MVLHIPVELLGPYRLSGVFVREEYKVAARAMADLVLGKISWEFILL